MGLTQKESIAFHRNTTSKGKLLAPQDRERMLKRILPTPRGQQDTMSVPQGFSKPQRQKVTRNPSSSTRKAAATAVRHHRRKPIRNLIRAQFHILIYTLIQFFFGLYVRTRIAYHAISERILAVLYYHHRTPELIRKDVRHLTRIPQHLSVILTLAPEDANSSGLEKLVNDVAEISAWCASAGIPGLSIYERTGILKRYIPHTHHAITKTLQAYFGNAAYSNCPTVSIRAPNVSTYSPPNTPPELSSPEHEDASHPQHLSILLLSAEDGRSTLVDLTKTLAEMAQKSKIEPDDISSELIDAEISESVMGEPDLLLVFGPKVVLEGYPPWQVRLTEIFHLKDNMEGVGYQVFLRALCNYAKAQMRFGR
jgi:dehydrodolichyl diphosphate syntase complex subunit NUS1